MAVDSKSAVDDPIEKTGAVFGDAKSAVGDSSVSIGSVYMSEDINSARPYVAVNEGHVEVTEALTSVASARSSISYLLGSTSMEAMSSEGVVEERVQAPRSGVEKPIQRTCILL